MRNTPNTTGSHQADIPGNNYMERNRSKSSGNSRGDTYKSSTADPLPLRRQIAPAELFPIDALGELLSPVARALIDVIQAPPAMCGQSVLAAAALAVQPFANVSVDGRQYPLSLYCLSVGDSGERKTAVDNIVLSPHRMWEKQMFETFHVQKSEYEAEKQQWDLDKKEGDTGPEPSPPLNPTMIAEEPTYEGLIKLFENGQPSIGIFSDEGGRLLGGYSMRPDDQLKTAAGLSSLWQGNAISRVRVDGAIKLYGKRLSAHLMVQGSVASAFLDNTILKGQGLPTRFLLVWPTSTIGTRVYRPVDLTSDPRVKNYFRKIRDVLTASKALFGSANDELDFRSIYLSPEAKNAWVNFHDEGEAQMGPNGALETVRGFASKAPEHAMRIAGVLTMVDDINSGTIRIDQMMAAIELTHYYRNEWIRLNDYYAADPDIILAEKLLEWSQQYHFVHLQQIYQYGPNSIRDKKTAIRVCGILEKHGFFKCLPGGMIIERIKRKIVWRVWRESRNN